MKTSTPTHVVSAPMVIETDRLASGGKYVAVPRTAEQDGGQMVLRLNVKQAGRWYVWGRVSWTSGKDNSFTVYAARRGKPPFYELLWDFSGVGGGWKWLQLATEEPKVIVMPLDLPEADDVEITITRREAGAKLDALFFTRDPKEQPR